MKRIFYIIVYLHPFLLQAQVISTFAGNGILGSAISGGLATATAIGYPSGCAFDASGNFFFSQLGNDKICKVSTDGIISTIAGTGTSGYNGDSIMATVAEINDPLGIAVDRFGNVYIADAYNNRVRKVDAITGLISTIAGNGTVGFGGDGGPSTASILYNPTDVCFDIEGNLYISDANNHRIRKIDTNNIITTFAGTGTEGTSGDGGPATAAELWLVSGICSDKIGNIYIAQYVHTFTVRKIDTAGIITTIAGNGIGGNTGDGGPATAAEITVVDVVCDNSGDIYISGYGGYDIREVDNNEIIHTVAGTGVDGYSGDGGPADSAELSNTWGISLDTCENLYIADINNERIRKISFNPYCWPEKVPQVVANEVTIYPNPATEALNIDNVKTESSYAILNITGIIEQQGILKQGSNIISVQPLPPGIYLLEMADEEGNKSVYKIVKQ